MSVMRGQTVYPFMVDKIVPGSPVFKKLYSAPGRDSLPPFRGASSLAYYGGGYYVDHLGFFCKQEILIQKSLHIPVFFRLGTLEYTNRLEGKYLIPGSSASKPVYTPEYSP